MNNLTSIYMSPQHAAFRATVRAFLKEHVLPHAESWEAARAIPRQAWKAFGESGLLGLIHPSSCGGQQRELFHSVVFLEELGRIGYGGIRAGISVHAYMATHYLARYGNAQLQQSYLAPAILGEMIAALAITEWDAGSDLSRLNTTAQLKDDHYIVDGGKAFITNGATADFYVIAARTTAQAQNVGRGNTGISLLVVDAKADGVSVSTQEKIGWHSAGTAEIKFESVKVPQAHLIGRINSGFMYLMRGFQLERLVAAILALGGVDRCLESTLEYLTTRDAFDGKLSELQSIRHRLANLASELASARMFSYHAAWSYQNDELSVKECSMAKLLATDLACRAADECLQLQGARGYLATSEISRIYRDARAGSMAGGATEVMRDIVAQQIIELGGFPAANKQKKSVAA